MPGTRGAGESKHYPGGALRSPAHRGWRKSLTPGRLRDIPWKRRRWYWDCKHRLQRKLQHVVGFYFSLKTLRTAGIAIQR